MNRVQTTTHVRPRSGVTLLEMLLVLGILLVVAVMAVPQIQSLYDTYRLKSNAANVRENVAKGRTYAIDRGVAYQFRYEPGKQTFVLIPDINEMHDLSEGATIYRYAGQLDEGLKFQESFDTPGKSEKLKADWFEGMESASALAELVWSEPIEFRFDGVAVDSSVSIIDEENREIRVKIRGLTGGVTVTPISWEHTDS